MLLHLLLGILEYSSRFPLPLSMSLNSNPCACFHCRVLSDCGVFSQASIILFSCSTPESLTCVLSLVELIDVLRDGSGLVKMVLMAWPDSISSVD